MTITASYGGDGSHAASSGQATFTVTLPATATALTCRPVLAVLDKCTATVSDTSPGTATTPTGTVTFTSTGHGVFSATKCTLSGRGASASCAVYYGPALRGQTITASYGGDAAHQGSTGSTTLK